MLYKKICWKTLQSSLEVKRKDERCCCFLSMHITLYNWQYIFGLRWNVPLHTPQSLYFTKSSKPDSMPNTKILSPSCSPLSSRKKISPFSRNLYLSVIMQPFLWGKIGETWFLLSSTSNYYMINLGKMAGENKSLYLN